MEFYYHPLSTYSQKALIAFHEKGIKFEPKIVNLIDPASRAEFEQIYPIGKLPYFKPSAEHAVPESSVIIEYLDDHYTDSPRLSPAGSGDAARQVRFMDRMMDLYLNDPIVTLLFMKYGFCPQDDAAAEKARKHAAVSYQHLDKRLANQTWLCGEEFTIADCAAIPPLFYAQETLPFDAYPNVKAYWERAQHRYSYKRVMDEFLPLWDGMKAQQAVA
jgi:glutathione S-transferase